MAQLTLNNRTVTIIEELVFYTNFGHHSNLFNMPKEPLQTEVIL